jgi:hypothetical protein
MVDSVVCWRLRGVVRVLIRLPVFKRGGERAQAGKVFA